MTKTSIRLRWKKNPRETGLRAIGAGPRGSKLHDGQKQYASVYPLRNGFSAQSCGWYWVVRGQDFGGEYMNTCGSPVEDESTAKAQAMAYVKALLSREQSE